MKIITGSTNQNDSKYGPRAGKQCMSNCFSFLHAVYLNGIQKVLNRDSIDVILDNGSSLDQVSTAKLLLESTEVPEFRFFTEIPKKIKSNFGKTVHELSRSFNGTLESQHIDTEIYLGLLDFLLYGKNKQPSFMIITIGVMARAVFIFDDVFYLFDSHASEKENLAAIYICEEIDDLYALLLTENIENFYYDAVFIYFVEITDFSLDEREAKILVLETYKDPDISIDINDILEMRSSISSEFVNDNNVTNKTPPKKRKQETTSLDNNSIDKKRKQSMLLKYYNTEVDLLPSFYELKSQFKNILLELTDFPIIEDNINWTIYIFDSSLQSVQPFLKPFLWNRVFHIFSQVIDSFLYTENYLMDETKKQEIIIKYFFPFKEFSNDFTEILNACQENNLDIVHIYQNYISKITTFRKFERIILTKFSVIVDKLHTEHFKNVHTWVSNLIKHMVKHPEDTNAFINNYVQKHPLNHHYICLNKTEKQSISLLLRKKRLNMLKDLEIENKALIQMQTFIENLGESPAILIDFETANKVNVENVSEKDIPKFSTDAVSIPNHNMFTAQNKKIIETLGNTKIKQLLNNMDQKLTRILQENFNNIAAGFLPVTELNNLFAYFIKIYFDVYNINMSGFIVENELIASIEQMYDNLQYIRFGLTHFSMKNLSPYTISIRKMFLDFFTTQTQIIDKAKEIIENLEHTTQEPNKSEIQKKMLKAQLEQLNAMEIDTNITEKTKSLTEQILLSEQELQSIQDFILQLSIYNIPSIAFIKGLKLHIILEKKMELLTILEDKVQYILHLFLKDLLNEIAVHDNVLTTMLFLIEQFPSDKKKNLLEVSSFFRHIIKKFLNLKTLQDGENLLRFLSINEEQLQKLLQQPFAKDMDKLLSKINLFYQQKVIEYQEDVWSDMANKIVLTSPSDLTKFLASAPTERIIQKHKNALDQKLSEHMEQQAKLNMETYKKQMTYLKTNLESHLNELLLLLKDKQFASIQISVLNASENIIKTLQDENIIFQFTHALLPVLLNIEKELKKHSSEIIENILVKKPIPTDHVFFEKTYNPLRTVLQTLKKTSFATIDIQSKIDYIDDFLYFIKKFKHETDKNKLARSIYSEDFKLYEDLLNELKKDATNIKDSLTKLFKLSEQKIDLTRTISSKEIFLNIEKLSLHKYKDAVFQENAFKSSLENEIKNYEKKISDLVKHFNSHLKAKLEHKHIVNLSFQNKWKNFIANAKITFPQEININTQALIEDPIKSLTEILTKAYNDFPYIISEKVLRWLIMFIQELNRFCLTIITEFGEEIISFNYKHLRALEYDVNTKHIEIENKVICNETIENSNNIDKITVLIKQLNPNRIAGGKDKFQFHMNKILKAETDEQQTRLKEQLKKQYFELLDNVANFRFSFDFAQQQTLISNLKENFKSLKTDNVFERFPNVDDSFSSSINPTNFIKALEALNHFVTAAQSYFQNFLTSQTDYFQQICFLPIELTATKSVPKADVHLRLKISTEQKVFFQVSSVFNTQLVVDVKSVPIQFYNVFENIIFKFFALNYKNIQTPGLKINLVSTKFKLLTVVKSILDVVQLFWKDIINFDLHHYFKNPEEFTLQNLFPIINLKIFVYIIVKAWTIIPDSTQHAFELPLDKFTLLIIASNPEFLYGAQKNPIDLTINSLAPLLDKQKYFSIFSIAENPPKQSIDEMKIICLDIKKWEKISLEKYTFKKTSFTQLCNGKEKLLIYLMSALVLPQNFLNYIWLQYKPKKYTQHSFQHFLHDLCFEYTHQNKVTTSLLNPQELNTMKHGEKILSKITLETQEKHFLKTFLKEQYLFDYLLFSYLTATEMTFSLYVDIIEKNFILNIRHLENVLNNDDFKTVLQVRNFNLNYVLLQSWTQNVLEQSIFQTQLNKLIENIKHPESNLQKIPLVLFNQNNEFVSSYLPPEHKNTTKMSFRIKNIFPISVEEYSSEGLVSFKQYPKSTKFLFDTPPSKTQKKQTVEPFESLHIRSLTDPTIQRTPVKGLVLKENEITVLPESNVMEKESQEKMSAFIETFNTLTHTKNELSNFSTKFEETISKIKSMYL
ncbi:large tegument protein [macacine betaherpesvirus 9]|uniref:Large tegument protein n=1 Tax=macacine betaherpesvirus 9 TaxID=2560568 RepID=A0A191S3Q9_9BETA|nr:large tegument protein [macacine betaherpesvirus 9]ANC96513.1 large tegument protein [macacine betaherpesvirus 9]